MISLRSSLSRLSRFRPGEAVNLSAVAEYLNLSGPVSLRDLIQQVDRLPDTVPFHATVVTGAALGGNVELALRSDGSYTFSGSMNASGFASFTFTVVALVRSSTGRITPAAQHSGEVFGLDTPGDRKNVWSEEGANPEQKKLIRNTWPDLSAGTISERHSSDVGGVLGAGISLLGDLAEFLGVAETLGVGLAVCLVIGEELGRAGIALPGLGGVIGITVSAGVVYIFGPSSIIAAVVAGVVVGEIVDALVQLRKLTEPERDFARQVFGDSLDFDKIRLTNLTGLGGTAFTAPTVGGISLVNLGNAIDDPIGATFPKSYPRPGQIFIHELAHAWQIQHASLEDGFVPGLMCQGIINQSVVSDPYGYGPAGPPWSSFNLEAQAAIVDQWFGGNGRQKRLGIEEQGPMNKSSPYFNYIANNILPGRS